MRILLVLAIALALCASGFFVARKFFPRIVQETEIKYVDRDISRVDTVTVERPVTRVVYRQVTDTVKQVIYVPRGFDGVGVISASPIRFDSDGVVVTYWSMDSNSFVQDYYRVPRKKIELGIGPYVGLNPLRVDGFAEFGLQGDARYKSLELYSRLYTITSGGIFWTFGLKLDLWTNH